MFCWLFFLSQLLCSVKKLKQEVLLDQCCLLLVKWSIWRRRKVPELNPEELHFPADEIGCLASTINLEGFQLNKHQ